jgi:hypothetical protein
VGAGTSLYNAMKGAEGGLPSEFKQSGIMSFSAGGISNDIEHDLYSMDEDDLQRQLKESSSPSVKRMAQRILRMKQMENQQPGMAGGGIIAFAQGDEVKEPTSSELLQQRVMQGKPTGDVMAQPQGIVQAPAPVPPKPLTAAQAIQESPEIPTALKGMYNDATTEFNKPVNERIAAIQQAKKEAGIPAVGVEQREKLMAERANADDEARRNRYLRAAEFFAQWGSTPGPTLSAGLNALKERVPDIIADEKEAKKARMEIDKAIAGIDEATRLESKGDFDAATAEKQKWADRMQGLNTKMIELEETEKRTKAQEKRAEIRADADAAKSQAHDMRVIAGQKEIEGMRLKAEEARARAASADRKDQAKWTQLSGMYRAGEAEIDKINGVRNSKSYMDNKKIVDDAEKFQAMDPEHKVPSHLVTAYPKALQAINDTESDIQKRKDTVQGRIRMYEKRTFGDDFNLNTDVPQATPGNRPQVKGAAARGAPPRAPIDSFYPR